jgi:hypothetical protein
VHLLFADSTTDAQPDFYSTLWSLQRVFANPMALGGPAVDGKTPFEAFQNKADFVLSRLYEQTRRERVVRAKTPATSSGKRKREPESLTYPRFLTARSLLEHELSDQQFRCQVLLQFFILFQLLLTQLPPAKQQLGLPRGYILSDEQKAWVMGTVRKVREDLIRMEPDGERFGETVSQLMTNEARFVSIRYTVVRAFADNFRRSGRTTSAQDSRTTRTSTTRHGRSLQCRKRWRLQQRASGRRRAVPCDRGHMQWVRRRSRTSGQQATGA